MNLSDVSTDPGVVVQARVVVGTVELSQTDAGQTRQINNRVLLLPSWRSGHMEEAADLPSAVRAQIENFFISVDKFSDIKVEVRGWASAKKAMRFVAAHQR